MPIPLLFAAVPEATGQHMNASDAPCLSVGSGAIQTSCLATAARAADAALNRTFGQVIAALASRDHQGAPDDLSVQRLRRAEQAWIAYRDASCDAEYSLYDGGSGGPPAHIACLEALTRHRIAELDATYGWVVSKFAPPVDPAK